MTGSVTTVCVMAAFVVFCASGVNADAHQGERDFPQVIVSNFMKVDDVTGIDWPKRNSERSGMTARFGEFEVVYAYGGRERFRIQAGNVFLNHTAGYVTDVKIRPLWEPMPLGELVDRLEALLEEWDIGPTREATDSLAFLRERNWNPHRTLLTYSVFTPLDDNSEFRMRISSIRDQGWYVVIHVGADVPLRSLLRPNLLGERWRTEEFPSLRPLWIGQPAEQVWGESQWPSYTEWPRDDEGMLAGHTRLNNRTIAYMEGDRERFRVLAVSGYVRQRNDHVYEIEFLPRWKPAPMEGVIEGLRAVFEEWRVDLPEEAERKLTEWLEQPAIPRDFSWSDSSSAHLNKEAVLHWSVHPIPDLGWYVRMKVAPTAKK